MISNRGTQVFPDKGAQTDCVDHWHCRHVSTGDSVTIEIEHIGQLTNPVALETSSST